jgi:hypothetical protein
VITIEIYYWLHGTLFIYLVVVHSYALFYADNLNYFNPLLETYCNIHALPFIELSADGFIPPHFQAIQEVRQGLWWNCGIYFIDLHRTLHLVLGFI